MTSRFARRAAAVTASAAGLTVLMAAPAMAGVPEGWSNPDPMSWGHLWLLILVIPIGLAIVITAIFFGRGFLKGEGFTGGQFEVAPGMSSERPSAH